MKKSKIMIALLIVALIAGAAFNFLPSNKAEVSETEDIEKVQPVGPDFNADSAYIYLQEQCDFGPRTMNSTAHDKCEKWIIQKFEQYGCKVTTQKATLNGYDGTPLRSTNIMASYNPKATTRIMFCAHWDCRPWADNDPDSTNWHKPIVAANDAASGVGVMIELARILKGSGLELGVDFICFDAEDYGTPQWFEGEDPGDTWALGAQYFANNLPEGDAPRYGILLDMVGGVGAKFYREGMSMQYAPAIVKKVWNAARQVGYGSYFPKDDGGMITDDHIPVNQTANIPCIDVIPYYPDCAQSSFGPTWHTIADNMDNIDKNTLKAVGQTMVQVLFTEK